jgi:hypothetical protein
LRSGFILRKLNSWSGEAFRGFTHPLESTAGIVHQIKAQLLPSTYVHIQCSRVQSVILTGALKVKKGKVFKHHPMKTFGELRCGSTIIH